jgi:hypothetical protein
MTYPSDALANCEQKQLVNEGMANCINDPKDEKGLYIILDAKNFCSAKALIHAGVHPNNIIITQADKKEYNLMTEEARECGKGKVQEHISYSAKGLCRRKACRWLYNQGQPYARIAAALFRQKTV